LATLKKMEEKNVQKYLIHYGDRLNNGWKKLASKFNLKIQLSGISPLTHISFEYTNPLEVQTLYAQEMLEKGYLLGASVYSTYAYTDEILDNFINDSEPVFEKIKIAIESHNVKEQLKNDVIQAGFKRLTA
jgi:glutamate-1-semialdehyde 2,1-aminomutase